MGSGASWGHTERVGTPLVTKVDIWPAIGEVTQTGMWVLLHTHIFDSGHPWGHIDWSFHKCMVTNFGVWTLMGSPDCVLNTSGMHNRHHSSCSDTDYVLDTPGVIMTGVW